MSEFNIPDDKFEHSDFLDIAKEASAELGKIETQIIALKTDLDEANWGYREATDASEKERLRLQVHHLVRQLAVLEGSKVELERAVNHNLKWHREGRERLSFNKPASGSEQ